MRIGSSVCGAACAAVFGLACAGGVAVGAEGGTAVGPPAVCVPVECEEAGVRIGKEAFGTVKGYSVGRAMEDGLRALEESDDVLSHMETLRRVVVYLNAEGGKSNAFVAQLLARAAESEAAGGDSGRRALAWFDAGYFVGASAQMGTELGWKAGYVEDVAGLGWIERAIGYVRGGEVDAAAMHFGAANVAHPAMRHSKRDLYERHMRGAIGGAAEGSLLMKNLRAHAAHWDESIERLRKGE